MLFTCYLYWKLSGNLLSGRCSSWHLSTDPSCYQRQEYPVADPSDIFGDNKGLYQIIYFRKYVKDMAPILVPDLKNIFIFISLHISYGPDIQKAKPSSTLGVWILSASKVQDKKLGLSKSQDRSPSLSGPSDSMAALLGRCDSCPHAQILRCPNLLSRRSQDRGAIRPCREDPDTKRSF